MITGFNTDIKHHGQVFHIQTEDKGLSNPVIESLVYKGGEILATRRSSYKELIGDGFSEKELTKLMEEQHKKVIFDIQSGRMDMSVKEGGDAMEPSGNRSLDEMIIDYLGSIDQHEKLKIKLPGVLEILAGFPSEFVVSTRGNITLEPIAGAKVAVNFAYSGKSVPLFSGVSDKFGKVTARFTLPDGLDEEGVLVISATSDQGEDEFRHLIRKSR